MSGEFLKANVRDMRSFVVWGFHAFGITEKDPLGPNVAPQPFFAESVKRAAAAMDQWMVLPFVEDDQPDTDATASALVVSTEGEKKEESKLS